MGYWVRATLLPFLLPFFCYFQFLAVAVRANLFKHKSDHFTPDHSLLVAFHFTQSESQSLYSDPEGSLLFSIPQIFIPQIFTCLAPLLPSSLY